MEKKINNKQKKALWTILIIVGVIIAAYFIIKNWSGQNESGPTIPVATTTGTYELETNETTAKPSEAETTAKPSEAESTAAPDTTAEAYVVEDQQYSDKDHVAAYIHEFGHLPSNYISKNKADNTSGWQKNGYYIGGDRFGNYEGLLPKKSGRTYYECDISYSNNNIKKGNRGTKRIVYSNDGLIFYTEDHYEHFTQLYP